MSLNWSQDSYILRLQEDLILYNTIPTFTDLEKEAFRKNCQKRENADSQYFLPFQQCFLPLQKLLSAFELCIFCCLQIL